MNLQRFVIHDEAIGVSRRSWAASWHAISHDPSPANLADILLYYTVQTVDGAASLAGVDLFNPGHNVTIRETVCATPFNGGTCSTGLLADLIVQGNGSSSPRSSRPPTFARTSGSCKGRSSASSPTATI